MDLTVPDAEKTRRFYESVVGWKSMAVDMDGYSDYCMNTPGEEKTVAGVCHARGENAGLPPQWMIYITVANLAESLERCVREGGKQVGAVRETSGGRIAVIQDPSGAFAALFEAPPSA